MWGRGEGVKNKRRLNIIQDCVFTACGVSDSRHLEKWAHSLARVSVLSSETPLRILQHIVDQL